MPHPTDVHVGFQLRAARILHGMTQTQLGDRLGISFQQVQKYEKGTNRIGGSRLWDMCRILNVTPGYFFEGLEGVGPIDEKVGRRALQLAKELDCIEDEAVKDHFLVLLRAYNRDQAPQLAAE